MSYEEKIRKNAPQMSGSFIVLADFFLHYYIDASFMTAGEIAKKFNLDAATIVRFAQFIGFEGFLQLQREIQEKVKNELARIMSESDSVKLVTSDKSYSYEEKIQQQRPRMSRSFIILADYLLNSFIEASFMKASAIANTLNLDAATVVRFSQFVGYSGFPQLHKEIQERVKDYLTLILKERVTEKPIQHIDVLIKRASNGKVKLSDLKPMEEILSQQVEIIRAYLQGREIQHISDEKLCDWVNFCYTFEMYQEGRDLFAFVSQKGVHPWYYERTKKIARLCELRAL